MQSIITYPNLVLIITISPMFGLIFIVYIYMICVTDRYELQQRGLLHEEDIGVVPDIYSRNQDLDGEVKFLKLEVAKYKEAAM